MVSRSVNNYLLLATGSYLLLNEAGDRLILGQETVTAVQLTLDDREVSLSLASRSNSLILDERTNDLTLEERGC